MAKKPKKCGCGCGGMTKGGQFLPGHDAKLKGFLKKAAREDHSEAAFERLVALGWAQPSERTKYLGFTVSEPTQEIRSVPEAPQFTCVVCGAPIGVDEYEARFHHCGGCWERLTPANALKASARIGYLDISDRVFDKLWDRAMAWGWPAYETVLNRLKVIAPSARPDRHENAVRTYRTANTTRNPHFRQIEGQWYGYLVRVGNYDVLRSQSNGGSLQVRRTSPRSEVEDAFEQFPLQSVVGLAGADELMAKLADEVALYRS